VGVPTPGQVARQGARGGKIRFLGELPDDHPRDFPDLDVLEAQLAEEELVFPLGLRRRELVTRRLREQPLFLEGRVPAKLAVEFLDRTAGGFGFFPGRRRQEPSKELVQIPVFPHQGFAQRPTGFFAHRVSRFFHAGSGENDAMAPARRLGGLFVLFAASLACRERGDPVRETLDRIVRAAEKRDAAGVVENLSSGYRDAEGQSSIEVAATLRRYFAAYEILNVRVTGLEIERAAEAARARFRAELSGQPTKLGGLDRLLPSSSRYDFDVRLAPEEGHWKVAWASWRPAP
jgi:hypothetical protein